jgi:LmbE family N-acetylglucosaminyl deacetylase
MMNKPMLVIAAHPDDEVLGCGGTIVRSTQEGRQVHIAILGEGLTSRQPTREETDPAGLEDLALTADKVGAFLGATAVHRFGYPDNRFDQVPLLDVAKTIETLINELQPSQVFTQHGGDLNIDHAVTFRATMTATRPLAGSPIRALFAYEVPSSSEWAFEKFAPRFDPNQFVDITSTIDQKVRAMAMYETESRVFPHPRSPEALKAIARKWGSTVGFGAAEAFQQIWKLE